MSETPKILLGLGGTVDFEIEWDAMVLGALARSFEISLDELTGQQPIDSQRSLLVSILTYLREGSGGERHVSSSELITEFASHFEYKVTLGGTGVRAGIALAQFGVSSVAHLVSIDENVRRLLPPEVSYLCSATEDIFDPHLIIQYPADATVELTDGAIRTGQTTRLIYAHDVANRELVFHPQLENLVSTCDVFLACGFNGVRDEGVLDDRLTRIVNAIDRRALETFIFFEDAGYHIAGFASTVRREVARRVSVYSMNEDELQELLGRRVALLDGEDVGTALSAVHKLLDARNTLVHTQHWAALVGPDATDLQSALEMGVLFAATRFRVGDAFSRAAVEETKSWPSSALPADFIHALSAVIKDPIAFKLGFSIDIKESTTIGLGDTFAGGFIYAIYLDLMDPSRKCLTEAQFN